MPRRLYRNMDTVTTRLSGALLTASFVTSVFGPFDRALYAATAVCTVTFGLVVAAEHLLELRRRRRRATQRLPRPSISVLRQRYASF